MQDSLTSLTNATTTAQVRAVAVTARQQSEQAKAAQIKDPKVQADVAALSSIATLEALNADTLGSWPTMRGPLDQTLAAASETENPLQTQMALTKIDGIVSSGQQALATWQTANATAIAARDTQVKDLGDYEAAVMAQLSRYNQLRNETGDWVTRSKRDNSYNFSESMDFFDRGTADRRAVRDSISALKPPTQLRGNQDELLAVLTEAINGMQSAVDGMREQFYSCYGVDCRLTNTAGYQDFLRVSDQLSGRYGKAYDDLIAAIELVRAEMQNQQLPPQPEI